MYLDGQLPHGPQSSNLGGQVNPDGVSALDGSGDPVIVSPMPQDQSGNTFFTVPEGGEVIVSPSLATSDGIVQFPVNRKRGYQRGDKPAGRNAPRGWTAENPDDWAPATCGLGDIASDALLESYRAKVAFDPAAYASIRPGRPYPDVGTCVKIQCGKTTQAEAGPELLNDCAAANFGGVESCRSPICAPYCPTQLISPGAPAAPLVIRQPSEVSAYVPGNWQACPGYGSDGSLVTLRGDGGRNAGLSGCCQSGYQVAEEFAVPSGLMSPWLLLAGLAGLALLTKGGR